MVRKHKPKPINTSLSRKPQKSLAVPIPEQASPAFNEDSPIIKKQIAKQSKSIAVLQDEVHNLRSETQKEGPALPAPVVNILPRARIAKIIIKYDAFGAPMEMIPKYTNAEV